MDLSLSSESSSQSGGQRTSHWALSFDSLLADTQGLRVFQVRDPLCLSPHVLTVSAPFSLVTGVFGTRVQSGEFELLDRLSKVTPTNFPERGSLI